MEASVLQTPKTAALSMSMLDSSCSRCREISWESAEVGVTKSDSKSVAYEFRTKSAQSGGLETNGPERENFGSPPVRRSAEVFARSPWLLGISSALKSQRRMLVAERTGGGRGIRTHDTVSRIHAFQACAFSHSAIPPIQEADEYSEPAGRLREAMARARMRRPVNPRCYRSRRRSISDFSWPPSISIMVPLTKNARSDARNVTRLATSSDSAMRPSGMLAGASLSASSKREVHVARHGVHQAGPALRAHRPGVDGDEADIVPAVLAGERDREVLSRGIGGAGRDLPVGDLHAVIADDVHHAAFLLLLHDRQHVLHAAHIAHELELQRARPFLLAQMLDDAAWRRAGIVDEDVDAPQRGMRLLDEILRVLRPWSDRRRWGRSCARSPWRSRLRPASSGSLRRAQMATSTPSRAKVRVTALPMPALAPVTTAFFPCKPKSIVVPPLSTHAFSRGISARAL